MYCFFKHIEHDSLADSFLDAYNSASLALIHIIRVKFIALNIL